MASPRDGIYGDYLKTTVHPRTDCVDARGSHRVNRDWITLARTVFRPVADRLSDRR